MNLTLSIDEKVVHEARLAGCSTLDTEDLRHGAVIGGVRIVNPFQSL